MRRFIAMMLAAMALVMVLSHVSSSRDAVLATTYSVHYSPRDVTDPGVV